MKNYFSVNKTSTLLSISKYTLRYYDKLGLLSPARGENSYRYYSEEDIRKLRMIEIMKYAGLSLGDIKEIIKGYGTECSDPNCILDTVALVEEKREELIKKIASLHGVVGLFNASIDILKNIKLREPEQAYLELDKLYNQVKGE